MPGKSQRKHLSQSKKRKKRRGSSAIAVQQQPVAQTYEPVSQPVVSAPSPSELTPKATPSVTTSYPYIVAELRRIGILAGIMLAVLVVLALVLG
jgi:hypothetical protein